ncbi:MAG: hypothetical protein KGR16_03665 [Verrucomicrobia bacterium]|nr:hypothetical protein [Verrucomicrobiota bacterium]
MHRIQDTATLDFSSNIAYPIYTMRKLLIMGLFLTCCYKDHLYVQQEWVDRNFLASTHVNTPDPRQACPPEGQRLLIAWRFPMNMVDAGLSLDLTVRLWDNQEEHFIRPITQSHGHAAFNFFDHKRILTYKIDILNAQGEVIEVWEHQFWTKLIDVDRSSSAVSSQPKQGSVMEMP